MEAGSPDKARNPSTDSFMMQEQMIQEQYA
jgi:hypothetical protein